LSTVRLQRHAPCPCGSLRALADCCLPWEEAFRRLVARLAAFAAAPTARRLEGRAAAVFWNTEAPGDTPHGRSAGNDACFAEWFLHDYVAPKRTGPLLGEFADGADGLIAREERLLFSMLLTPIRAFEIAEPPGPRGVAVKDLLAGSEWVLGPLGVPDGLIRSDVCIGRLLPVGRLGRPGIGLLRLPPGSQGELMAYLRATYRLSRAGRHVSLEDYADRAGHLYHHFFLDRGRELGGRAHRTCRWTPFIAGQIRYCGDETVRIRAELNREPELEPVTDWEDGARYLWLDPVQGVTAGTVWFRGDEIQASAETEEDLGRLGGFLESCLRGLVRREPVEAAPTARVAPASAARHGATPAGAVFIRGFLERWPEMASPTLSDETPREACRSAAGREAVVQLLLGLERDMARQKRLDRAWGEIGPLWEGLSLSPPSLQHGSAGEERVPSVTPHPRSSNARGDRRAGGRASKRT
jgi:hypothetical protein